MTDMPVILDEDGRKEKSTVGRGRKAYAEVEIWRGRIQLEMEDSGCLCSNQGSKVSVSRNRNIDH